ncbi:nuclear transport factor 2 family protein [Paenibacillus elgii]|uniref:nuclear transport factor 2 family protein n=1 Tax=Paenibacillus elgii TaxID=189691 RepID=UPI00203CECD6|nr:nuclear transport factor 2 family protein [Paenibacillus elgii]MCM3268201.1 nuclear transport factor 2 family protein [Paenibacillus elgii]
MNNEQKEAMIRAYIRYYNSFDVDGIVSLLHEEVRFRNVSNGEVTTETVGVEGFRSLAVQSAAIFESRCQKVLTFRFHEEQVEVEIDYEGTLGTDLPGGTKAGETIKLRGSSQFSFQDGKISAIEDRS